MQRTGKDASLKVNTHTHTYIYKRIYYLQQSKYTRYSDCYK